jgi:hypothetical protein
MVGAYERIESHSLDRQFGVDNAPLNPGGNALGEDPLL